MTEMADNQKKENFFVRMGKGIVNYSKATKSELKKVSWPTRKQLINNTLIVIACVVVVAIFIFVLDAIFLLGNQAIVGKKTAPEPITPAVTPTEVESNWDEGSTNFDIEFEEIASEFETDATDGIEAGSEAE